MSHTIYKPAKWDPDEEWLKYIATRIEWMINLGDYGISEQHSVSLSKEGTDTIIRIDGSFVSKSTKKIEINAALYDNDGYIKDSIYLFNDVIKGESNFFCPLKAKNLHKFDKIVIIGNVREAVESDMFHYLTWNYELRNLPELEDISFIPWVTYNHETYYDFIADCFCEGPAILDELRIEINLFDHFLEDASIDFTLYDDDDNIRDTKNIRGNLCKYDDVSCVLKAKVNLLKLKKIVISGKIKKAF